MSSILTAVSNVMGKVGSVRKEGFNEFHKYKYAAVSDVLRVVQPAMAEEGLVVLQSERSTTLEEHIGVLSVTYEFVLAHKDGSTTTPIIQTGTCSCINSKGGFDDKATNKCHTAARKYFLLALFQIPTGDYDDADAQVDRVAQPLPDAPVITAPKFQAPVNPETGEVSPHKIAVNGNWIKWGGTLIAALKSAKSEDEADAWASLNEKSLAEAREAAPKVYDRIEATFTSLVYGGKVVPIKPTDAGDFLKDFDTAMTQCAKLGALEQVWTHNSPALLKLNKTENDLAVAMYQKHEKRLSRSIAA